MHPSNAALARRQYDDLKALNPGTYFEEAHPALSLTDAYAVQDQVRALRTAHGERVGGYKLGCLGPKIRETFQMDGPIRGTLFENEFHRSGTILSCSDYANLAIEGEMAIRIGADGAAAGVFPVIELHHLVLRGEPRTLPELIANNGLSAGAVFPVPEDRAVVPDAMLHVEINHTRVDTAPLWGFPGGFEATLAWLKTHLGESHLQLEPGQVVLAGTLGGIHPVRAGDEVRISLDGGAEVTLYVRA